MGVEQIFLILLIVFALFSVFATNLKHAIIGMGCFGLWMSFAYLFYHAPDVAIAEAVIASSLGTILYIITIKKYNDITIRPTPRTLLKGIWADLLLIVSCMMVIYLARQTYALYSADLFNLVMESYYAKGSQINPVANIYLNYRIFDTLFEALMLLVSGIAVVYLIKHQRGGASHE